MYRMSVLGPVRKRSDKLNPPCPYINAVVGEKEHERGTVSVRTRAGKQLGQKSLEEVMSSLVELRQTRSNQEEF